MEALDHPFPDCGTIGEGVAVREPVVRLDITSQVALPDEFHRGLFGTSHVFTPLLLWGLRMKSPQSWGKT